MKIRHVLALLTLLLLVYIAGCANKQESASTTTTAATEPSMQMDGMDAATVNVDLTEWAITLKPSSVKAGMIHFMVKNSGKTTHTFAIKGNGVNEKLAADLEPGGTDMLMVTLKPGIYETNCPIGRHTDKGMKNKFKVE
ncbi:MAG: hypothetical protein ACYC0V_12270 [Armatimonadota bacterium]